MRKYLQTALDEFRKKDNMVVFIASTTAFAVMLGVTAAFLLKPAKYHQVEAILTDDAGIAEADQRRHPLTGELLEAELVDEPQVYGVMIENSADAWPLSGIEDAFLVIEAPVEGSIPRFLAFFSSEQMEANEVEKIGPVRSARPYYLDWSAEFNGLYAHVGGSPEALEIISERDMFDLNEFYQGEYFWRDVPRRAAPHNVYTSTELLAEAALELKLPEPEYKGWLFKEDAPIGIDPVSVVINWGEGSLYDVEWLYDPAKNAYLREQDGAYKTQDGDSILANNIVIVASDITVVDSVGRRHIRTLGSGDALIAQDGKLILGTWKKMAADERIRFYDSEDHEIRLNAGKTWMEVVPSVDRVSTATQL